MNPDDWPNVDLKPSKGSVKGQRYVGPGGEKIDNLEGLTVKVRTERHGGGDISSRVTFQGAKVRKPLLEVSGVIDKGNIVVFDGSGSFHTAKHVCRCRICEKDHHRGSRKHTTAFEKWSVRLANVARNLRTNRRRVSVSGEPLSRAEHQAQ